MRKHFFRAFIADPECASSGPGHHVDIGRFFMAVVKTSVIIPVRAEVCDYGFIRLDWDGQYAELWNHRPDDVEAALRGTDGVAEWAPDGGCCSRREQRSPTSAPCSRWPIPTSTPSALPTQPCWTVLFPALLMSGEPE